MYRGGSTPAQRDYPTSPKLNRRALGPSRARRFFSPRARLHPVVLVPVFLCGCLLAPWFSEHLGGGGGPRLPDPVYNPQEYQWRSDVFAPADAPPLVPDDDDDATGARDPGPGAAARRAVAEAAAAHNRDDQEWEWWEPPVADPDAASPSPSLADLTSSLYTVHAGLLYFRTSPALIPRASLSQPFPVAPLTRPGARPVPPFPVQPDQGLGLPPSAPKDWLLPGELFTHSPGHRRHAIAPPSGAESRGQPVPLRAPLPAARRVPAPLNARERAALRERNDPGRSRGKQERDAQGRVLGANAAAAARALKAGMPFIPGKPAELLEEERKLQVARERARALDEAKRGVKWEPAPVDQGPRHVVLDGHAVIDEDEDDEDEDEADALWRGGAGGAAKQDAEDALAGSLEGNDDDGDDGDEDDAALLEAVRALSPDEFAQLTDDERALVAEIEAKQAAAAAAPAPAPRAAKPEHPPKPRADRRVWRAGDDEALKPRVGNADALRRAQALREERRLNPPHVPLPKPVFKGQAGQLADKNRREGRGLVKRGVVVEGGGELEGVVEPLTRMLRKRAAIVAEPADALAERVVADGEVASAPPASPTESDAAVPPPPPATLARRAVAPDEASPRTLPDRLHPISHLVARAEEEWDDMLRRQSQTLEQAVAEYRRRYKMNPPVGFDSWWRYAMQNRVILVDEYDQVHSDVLPFLSLPPSEFRRRVMSLSTDQSLPWFKQSFQLKVRDGAVTAGQGAGDAAERREAVLDLLAEFSEMLPDMEVRMSKGDEPMVVVSGEARERHERLARDGKLLGTSPAFEIAEPSGFTPWDSLCPPNSTARRIAQALPVDTPRGNTLQSFVSIEHVQAMDLCEHPEVRDLNGFTAWSGPRPYLLYPLFSFTKTSLHADLLLPSVSGDFFAEIGRDPVWEQKKQNRVLWRGETTGAYHSKGIANAKDGDTTLHLADSTSDALRLVTAPTRDMSHHYFDVAYTGVPKQCSAKDTTCKQLQHEMRFDKWLSADEENKFKYVLDVDANYASGKFKRLMSSRSLVFKSTIFPEWWSKRIMPWYHYVPIQSDYSDLTDTAAFFIGAPDGTGSHNALAKRIAQQGKKWSEDHFREADMAAYTFRLLLEYARLLHREDDDLQSMDYKP